jgi:hypothetical protein
MMKKITLSFLTVVSIVSATQKLDHTLSQDHTYEKTLPTSSYKVAGWNIFGDVRAGYLIYDYANSPIGINANNDIVPQDANTNKGHTDSKGAYIIPKISIRSPYYHNFMFQITGIGVTDFGINDEKYESRNFVFDPNERKSYALLQEAFLYYGTHNNRFLIGREELTTPMIDADDWYMLADSFELARYSNKQLKNITFNLGYFHKMAGVWDSGTNGTEFHSMSDASFIDSSDKQRIGDTGVYFGSFLYNDEKHHNFQLWEYYAQDMYNTVFLQYDYTNSTKNFNYDIGFQIIDFDDVGKLEDAISNTHINYTLYSARFNGDFSNGLNFATGISKYTDGDGQGATLGAWGGYPYFANGMIFHFFEAGSLRNASSYKGQVGFDFEKIGLKNMWVGYRATYFNLDSKYSKNSNGEKQDSMLLNGIRLSYGSERGTYFTGTYEHVNLDHEPNTFSLRLIGGYRF